MGLDMSCKDRLKDDGGDPIKNAWGGEFDKEKDSFDFRYKTRSIIWSGY